MKKFALFIFSFILTLMATLSLPSVREKISQKVVASLGIDILGKVELSFFPLEVTAYDIALHDGEKKLLECRKVTVSIDRFLEPYLTLLVDHPLLGASQLLVSSKKEGKRALFSVDGQVDGPWGKINLKGSLPIPKKGLKLALQEGRPLFSTWKIDWEKEEQGSAIGYATLGWKEGTWILPSFEAAGYLFDHPFTLEGEGEKPLFLKGALHAGQATATFKIEANLIDFSWKGSAEISPPSPLPPLQMTSEGSFGKLSPITFYLPKEGIKLLGEIAPSEQGGSLFLHKVEGTYKSYPLSLGETAIFSSYGGGWRLDRLFLNWGEGFLRLSGGGEKEMVSLSGALNLPLSQALREWKGQAEGTLDIFGFWDHLEGIVSLRGHSIENGVTKSPLFPLNGEGQISLSPKEALFKGHFLGKGGESIAAEGTLSENFEIETVLTFEGEMAPYFSLLLPDTTSASGQGVGLFQLSGPLESPLFRGKLSVQEGSYEDLAMGMLYRELEGEFSFLENQVTLQRFRTVDRQGGEILGTGTLHFQDNLPFTLHLEARSGELLNLDYAKARASGKVTIAGDRDQGSFKGELHVEEMDVILPQKTPLNFQKLDVTYEKIAPLERTEPWQMNWKVNIDFKNPAIVQNNLFISEWVGDFSLQGSTDAPLLFGKGKLQNGSFSFNGKTFVSKDGMILFQGEPGSKSTFYITAKEEIDDLKIEILLKGPLKAPELSFRSNPPKSTKEILSYLLFNRGTTDTSLFGEELTQSSIKLDSAPTDPNILERLKSGLGIDRLDISGDREQDPENVSVEVGKYLFPSLYFCLKKSVSDGPNQAAIVAKLPHHFRAEGEMGDDAEGKFLLKWEKDY